LTEPDSPPPQLVDTTAQAWRAELRILWISIALAGCSFAALLIFKLRPDWIEQVFMLTGGAGIFGFGIAVGQCIAFRRDHSLWFNNSR
jgi:hypothetical protein